MRPEEMDTAPTALITPAAARQLRESEGMAPPKPKPSTVQPWESSWGSPEEMDDWAAEVMDSREEVDPGPFITPAMRALKPSSHQPWESETTAPPKQRQPWESETSAPPKPKPLPVPPWQSDWNSKRQRTEEEARGKGAGKGKGY